MGILSVENRDNILTKHGFKYEHRSVTGELERVYEKCVKFPSIYYGWVAVSIETGEVFIYVEYDCGGEVATYSEQLENKWEDSQDRFFRELDELVTGIASRY